MSEFVITIKEGNYPSFSVQEVSNTGDLIGRNTDLYESGFSSYEEARVRCSKLNQEVEESISSQYSNFYGDC